MLLTEEEQNAQWVEHFKETLNQPEPSDPYDLSEEGNSQVLEVELGPITESKVKNAIKKLKNNKAAGLDDISAELLKHA